MKKCCTCGESRPLDDFHRNRSKGDGRATKCKPCAKVRNRAYYVATPERNPQRYRHRVNARLAAQAVVRAYLQTHPCVDCGERDIVVLEFDHVRGEKRMAVSQMVTIGMGADTIRAEIAKCDVRCANCHRRKTYHERGHASRTA